jgi:hypothetical protein
MISSLEHDLRANAFRVCREENRFPLFRIMLYLRNACIRSDMVLLTFGLLGWLPFGKGDVQRVEYRFVHSRTGSVASGSALSEQNLTFTQGDHAAITVLHSDGSAADHIALQNIDHIRY